MYKKTIFFFFFLVGCKGLDKVPNGAEPLHEVDIRQSIETALEEKSLFINGFWPIEDWWISFNDPCLNNVIATALEENPNLIAAMHRVDEAKAIAMREGGPRFPELSFGSNLLFAHLGKNGFFRSIAPTTVPANPKLVDLNFILTYEFDFWGKNRRRFEAAFGLYQSQIAMENEVRIDLSTKVAAAYYILRSYKEIQEKLLKIKALQEEKASLTQIRFQYKIGEKQQVDIEEAELDKIKKDLFAIEGAIDLQEHLLKVLMGKSPGEEFDFGQGFFALKERMILPNEISIGLLVRRPDLQAQIWKVGAAGKEIGIARALFYPDINISVGAGLESVSYTNVFSNNSLQGSLLPYFTLPLFTGGRLRGNLAAKIAAYQAYVEEYNNMVLNSAKDVLDSVTNIKSVANEIAYQFANIEKRSSRKNLEKLLYEQGIKNKIDYLQYAIEVLKEEVELIELERNRYQFSIQLIRALGGGYYAGD